MKQLEFFSLSIIAITIISLFGIEATAQQTNTYPFLSVEFKITGGDTLIDGEKVFSSIIPMNVDAEITLFDTTDISKIHFLIRKSDNQTLLEESFSFNELNRTGYSAIIELGKYPWMALDGEAWIERVNGTRTDSFKFKN